MLFGMEVSETDGNVEWHQMKERGIGFAILCAGYGSGSIDLQFRKNAGLCNLLGIPCGAYWISYAYTTEMARKEAEFCIETIEEFELAFPLCLKYSGSSVRYAESKGVKVTEELIQELGKAFCRRAKEAGYLSICCIELNKRKTIFDT